MPHFSYLTEQSDIRHIIFRKRERYKYMDAYTQQLMRGPSELSVLEREIIATYVSGLNACQFCCTTHKEIAINYGMDEALLEQLMNDPAQADISDKLLPLILLARKLTQTPSRVIQSDIDAAIQAGWSESAVEDCICVSAVFNYYNRLLDGHGIKGTPEFYKEGAAMVAKHGYNFPALVVWFLKRFKM
jgi:uncharacterized peroxidase-related enzyme